MLLLVKQFVDTELVVGSCEQDNNLNFSNHLIWSAFNQRKLAKQVFSLPVSILFQICTYLSKFQTDLLINEIWNLLQNLFEQIFDSGIVLLVPKSRFNSVCNLLCYSLTPPPKYLPCPTYHHYLYVIFFHVFIAI